MATAASSIRRARVGRSKPRLIVIHGDKELGRDEGRALMITTSDRYRARQELARLDRTKHDYRHAPERQSVAIAMLAVEARLVKAFWTIARQPAKGLGPADPKRCGLEYFPERGDLGGYADVAGGRWESVAPRPAIPSAKEIDDANEALDWLLHVDEGRRKILVAGATSKRGDVGRQISWPRMRHAVPELSGFSTRTCQGRYREALRIIVTELTLAHLAK